MHVRIARSAAAAWRACAAAALVAALIGVGPSLSAQRFRRSFRMATAESFDGAFQFCRAAYRGNRGGRGSGWSTDYPNADLNLSTRLGELTKTPISIDKSTLGPNHVIVQLTDPLLFRCPWGRMAEVELTKGHDPRELISKSVEASREGLRLQASNAKT